MTTKPENQQIQQGATAPSRGFKEQKREPTEALLIGVEREIEGGYLCPKCGVPKHPAPSYETGPNGETLLICESCGFMPGYEED